ncbi:MAG: helix-turn-helix domain-containing protein [Oleispira sp.]|nr:helix-turn-helix domain-containing protein [Oleispira sp.]
MMSMTNKLRNIEGFSRSTRYALSLIATEIQLARKKRKMTETELSTRVGCSRDTIRAIEAGKPSVAIAFVFEAAAMLGIELFDGTDETTRRVQENRALLRLMPLSARNRKPEFKDDF